MSYATIPSLAILKVNWDAGRDYIDNFVLILAETLRTAERDEVLVSELQAAVKDQFCITLPQGALRSILRRAIKRKYVTLTGDICVRNKAELDTLDFSATRDDVLWKYQAVLHKLVQFCSSRFPEQNWTPDQAGDALLAYLDRDSSDIVAAMVGHRLIRQPEKDVAHAEYIIRSFMADLCQSDPEGFGFIETIVKGSMLANVLIFPDLDQVERSLDKLEVYLDSQFVLQALGLEGKERKEPRLELIRLLNEQKAKLRVFQHTVDEIRRILSGVAHALRDPEAGKVAYGAIVEHILASGHSVADIDLAILNLERSIAGLGVTKVAAPPGAKDRVGYGEELRSLLEHKVGYRRGEAVEHDVQSVAAIDCLRRGRVEECVESCHSIFVTKNRALARVVTAFFREQNDAYRTDRAIPHVLPDYLFTTMVWLKRPLEAPDLPRQRIIADCYAAMNRHDELWDRYLKEITRLEAQGTISQHDYYILRFSSVAQTAIMDLIVGHSDSEAFIEGTIAEVLDKARAAARAEAEAALVSEVTAREAAEQKAIAAEQRAVDEAKRFEAQRQARRERIHSVAARVGRAVAVGTELVVILVLAALVFLVLYLPGLPGGLWAVVIASMLVPLGVFTVANLWFGATIKSAVGPLEVTVTRFVERMLLSLTEPQTGGEDASEVGGQNRQ